MGQIIEQEDDEMQDVSDDKGKCAEHLETDQKEASFSKNIQKGPLIKPATSLDTLNKKTPSTQRQPSSPFSKAQTNNYMHSSANISRAALFSSRAKTTINLQDF